MALRAAGKITFLLARCHQIRKQGERVWHCQQSGKLLPGCNVANVRFELMMDVCGSCEIVITTFKQRDIEQTMDFISHDCRMVYLCLNCGFDRDFRLFKGIRDFFSVTQ